MSQGNTDVGGKNFHHRAKEFLRDEDGSHTIEAAIWLPIFVTILAVIINISLVFYNESHMLRVVQDANRAYSLGRITTEEATEEYISQRISTFSDVAVVNSVVSGGYITTELMIPASDMMPMRIIADSFLDTQIIVSAQHIVEF